VLLSGNVKPEHVAAGEWVKQLYYLKLNTLSSVGQCYFQAKSKLNMSLQGKEFKQRYYRNPNILSLCRPVLLSGIVQAEHVVTWERV